MEDKIFIEVEGSDYSGKSTLLKNLQEQLDNEVHHFTYEPYNDEYRSILLDKPLSKQESRELFVKDRVKHIKMLSDLSHKYVWCDRYLLSTLVYQTEEESDIKTCIQQHDDENLPYPDLLVYLYCTKDVAIERSKIRADNNHFDEGFTTRSKKYRQVMKSKNTPYYGRIPVLEFDTSTESPEAIARHVWQVVRRKVIFV